jgi:integrase
MSPAERMKGKNAGKKQARPHAVPLTEAMLAILETIPRFKEGSFVFSTRAAVAPVWMGTTPKKRLAQMRLSLRAVARKRGEDYRDVELNHFVSHEVRRTVRSRLSRLKIAEEVREAVLAHVRPGIKRVYDIYSYFDEKRRRGSRRQPSTPSSTPAKHNVRKQNELTAPEPAAVWRRVAQS